MQENARGMYGSGCKVPGKYRGMPGELMRVGAVSGECWGIQGNAKGTYGSGCKLPKDCWDCRGLPGVYWSGGKVLGEGMGMQGNPREYREMPGKRMGVGAKCYGMLGNAGECQVNVWEWM